MFRKEYVFNKPNFYENILKNTEEKRVLFGYFLTSGEKRFRGVEKEKELHIYCTDYLFQGLNPLIKVKKNTDSSTTVAITYNTFQWAIILLEVLLLFVLILCLCFSFDWIVLAFVIAVILSIYLNFLILRLRSKKIIELMNSLQS